jgi:hypothetical protein
MFARRRWSSFVLGGTFAVLALTLVPFFFVHLSDAVSLSQSRRLAGFVPFAFAFAGGITVLAGMLRGLVLPLALAAGITLQLLWPGDFGYTLEHAGPSLVVWYALAGSGLGIVGLASRRLRAFERDGTLAVVAAALFVLPVVVHGFSHWSPSKARDPYALTPGLVQALQADVPERDVVFSDVETSYRIAGAAPVLIAAAPPSHVADTKQNSPRSRANEVTRFFRNGNLAIPRRYGAHWIVVDHTRLHPVLPLRVVYRDSRYSLYRL